MSESPVSKYIAPRRICKGGIRPGPGVSPEDTRGSTRPEGGPSARTRSREAAREVFLDLYIGHFSFAPVVTGVYR